MTTTDPTTSLGQGSLSCAPMGSGEVGTLSSRLVPTYHWARDYDNSWAFFIYDNFVNCHLGPIEGVVDQREAIMAISDMMVKYFEEQVLAAGEGGAPHLESGLSVSTQTETTTHRDQFEEYLTRCRSGEIHFRSSIRGLVSSLDTLFSELLFQHDPEDIFDDGGFEVCCCSIMSLFDQYRHPFFAVYYTTTLYRHGLRQGPFLVLEHFQNTIKTKEDKRAIDDLTGQSVLHYLLSLPQDIPNVREACDRLIETIIADPDFDFDVTDLNGNLPLHLYLPQHQGLETLRGFLARTSNRNALNNDGRIPSSGLNLLCYGPCDRSKVDLLLEFGVNLTPCISTHWEDMISWDRSGQIGHDVAYLKEKGVLFPESVRSKYTTIAIGCGSLCQCPQNSGYEVAIGHMSTTV